MHVSIFERKTIAPTLLGHFLDHFFCIPIQIPTFF